MNLIPQVKKLEQRNGFLKNRKLALANADLDARLLSALKHLPTDTNGTILEFEISDQQSEAYQLDIEENRIVIRAESCAGAFYAIQTLRQIYRQEQIPCLHIEDRPDFSYRGFYHDMTRGRIATVATIKELIDKMAYYKLNSLQLYVEHIFEFEETKCCRGNDRYLTKEDLREIDAYCQEHFIDFIPSLSTFGHMRDILEMEQYRHLRVLKDYNKKANFWEDRMHHHTIDPTEPDSFALVKSLINQYAPCFTSETFNICCDETFDLKYLSQKTADVGALYLGFVEKIAAYVQSLGKRVMMWGDILLQHPEAISKLPENVEFLNWYYNDDPVKMEQMIATFANLGRRQIVCPGTTTWNRFCEDVDLEEINIRKMAELGYQYKADGVLNTNWGDWGNPCCLDLAMYGLVLGAEKSWSVETPVDDRFHSKVNALLYGCNDGVSLLRQVSRLHDKIHWRAFAGSYFYHRFQEGEGLNLPSEETVRQIQQSYLSIRSQLEGSHWEAEAYKKELLMAAEAICIMAELLAKLAGYSLPRLTDTNHWIDQYSQSWRSADHESELENILELFRYFEELESPANCGA